MSKTTENMIGTMKSGKAARATKIAPKALIEIAFRHPEVIREGLQI